MPETLRTIDSALVGIALDNIRYSNGQTLMVPCLLAKTDQCPSKNIRRPKCGDCDVAEADQSSIQTKAVELGFGIASNPKTFRFLGANELYCVTVKDDIQLEVRHKKGVVVFRSGKKS